MLSSQAIFAFMALAASLHTCLAMKPIGEAATAYAADYKDLYACLLDGEDICVGVLQRARYLVMHVLRHVGQQRNPFCLATCSGLVQDSTIA